MSWKGAGAWGNKPAGGSAIKPIKPGPTGPGAVQQPKASAAGKGAATGAAAAGAAAKKPDTLNGKTPIFTVSTKSKSDEIGIQTLVGDYSEVGMNHTKKYFQKIQDIPGHKDVKVFLYYWDNRDGADFSGWWFGDQLGGSQVWARCNSHGQTPPKIGWKIPWDAPKPEPGILLVEPYAAASGGPVAGPASKAAAAKPAAAKAASQPAAAKVVAAKVGSFVKPNIATAAASPATTAENAERVKEATEKVEAAEAEAKEVLQKAKAMSASNDEAELKEVIDELTGQQTALNETQKSLTQDITEARKGGPTAVPSVTALSKLSPRLRTMITSISSEVSRIRGTISKAANEKRNSAELAGKETQHAEELQKVLPEVKETVSSAEDCVEAVVIMASPLVNDPPEELGEAALRSMDEVEAAATDAQEKITESRKAVNTKLQAARAYAPEARKAALAEFTALQDKLAEAQKKLTPYKNFKKDFSQRAEAKKALTDLVEKLAEAELEVEKAVMMSAAADQGQMSEDEVKSSEELTTPALNACNNVSKLLEAKLKTAAGVMKDELMAMKTRLMETRKKLDGVTKLVKRQREGLVLQKMAVEATEKVDAAEESLVQCQEAEMPFLKGIEVLPAEESTKAITESEKAATASSKVIEQAKTFIRMKLGEAKRAGQDVAKLVIEELTELQQRAEEVQKKLNTFKSDTADRKIAALMSEVLDVVVTAERKGKELSEATAIFSTDVLDDINADDLKTASEKAAVLDKEVATALAEAKKTLQAKQKDSKSGDLQASLAKINARLNAVQAEQMKAKKASGTADRMIKGKALVADEGAKVKEAEDDVAKAEEVSTPVEDEKLTEDSIKEMEKAITSATKTLKACQLTIQPQMSTAVPALKDPLQQLLDRCKVGLVKIDEIKKRTKEQREVVMSDLYAKEGKRMADDVEVAMNKVGDAELPFLMGTECLPLSESTAAIKASEDAAAEVQTAINEARSFLAAKNIEVKGFKTDNAKEALEEFAKITQRINGEANKLSQFRKDTDLRKKAMQVQEAAEKVSALEALAEKVAEAAKPFAEEKEEGADEDGLTEKWDQLSALDKEAKAKSDEVKTLLATVGKDSQGNAEKKKAHSELNTKMQAANTELMKARKLVSSQEAKFKAQSLMAEANALIEDMDAGLKKAAEFCAPLLEEGGERFLLASRVSFLTEAFKKRMTEQDLTEEAFLTEVNGGQEGNVKRETFLAYLAALPEAWGREELELSEERRAGVFEQMDLDKDGEISVSDLKEAMKKTYSCIQGVSVTESIDMASKTVIKLEVGDILECSSAAKKDGPEGVLRLQCKVVGKDKEGWVTMQGNSGTTFLSEVSEFAGWCDSVDAKLKETAQFNTKVSSHLNSKNKELSGAGVTGPLAEAKTKFMKLRATVTKAQMSVDDLKKKMVAAKKKHAENEEKEANAHITAREEREAKALAELEENLQKAGAALRADMREKSITVEDLWTRLSAGEERISEDEFAKHLVGLEGLGISMEQAKLVAQKLDAGGIGQRSFQGFVQQFYIVVKEIAITGGFELDTKEKPVRKADVDEVFEVLEGPVKDEKIGLERIRARSLTDGVEGWISVKGNNQGKVFLQESQKPLYQCLKDVPLEANFTSGGTPLRTVKTEEVLELMEGPRKEVLKNAMRVRGKASQDGKTGWFTVKDSSGADLAEKSGKFYVCTATVAMTDDFDIKNCKVVKKLAVDEVFTLLEDPQEDESSKITRIKGKSAKDGTEGWITIKGNAGSVYAKVNERLWSVLADEVPFLNQFATKGATTHRMLKKDEVVEQLEGPKEEKVPPATRVKCRASGDGAVGWLNYDPDKVKKFSGSYKVLAAQPLHIQRSAEMAVELGDAAVTRELSVGEMLELVGGPMEDSDEMRMRCRAKNDGAMGWVSFKDKEGKKLLQAS